MFIIQIISCNFELDNILGHHILSTQVKAFSRSLDLFKTAIVVGGTNISEQVMLICKIVLEQHIIGTCNWFVF